MQRGAMKLAQQQFHKLEDMFEMVSWSVDEEKYMMELLIEYVKDGKLFGDDCHVKTLTSVAAQLTHVFGKSFSYDKVEKKFKSLHARFNLWRKVAFWPGAHVNVANNKVEASEFTWNAIIEKFPAAKKYMKEAEDRWVELELIFSGQKRKEDDEEKQKKISFVKSFWKNISQPHVTEISSDAENDVENHVTDEQSCVGKTMYLLPLSSPSMYGLGLFGTSRARFDDEYDRDNSQVSSVASSMWP